MKIDVIPIKDLTDDLKKTWLTMQSSNPSLQGPFFHPELFLSVAKVYPNAYAALLYKENSLTGILPFLKNEKEATAKPIRFCNYEAIISPPDQYWDMDMLLKKMGLKSWSFDALVNFKNIKSKRRESQVRHSLVIDLNDGLEKYWAFIETKKVRLKDLKDKRRKLGLIKGPLKFVADCKDIKVLHQFVQWISLRYSHDPAWDKETTEVLEHLYHSKDPMFHTIMPALYTGDELVAVDFHLRYQGYLGGSLRTFNPHFEKFSVGVLLLHDLINEHEALGYSVFDLGPEPFQYKLEYTNSSFPSIQGKFKEDSLKEKIKSVGWLHQTLLPVARLKGKIVTKLSNSRWPQ